MTGDHWVGSLGIIALTIVILALAAFIHDYDVKKDRACANLAAVTETASLQVLAAAESGPCF